MINVIYTPIIEQHDIDLLRKSASITTNYLKIHMRSKKFEAVERHD